MSGRHPGAGRGLGPDRRLVVAAWQADPSEAKGLGDALDALAAQPFGPALLAAVGLGLVAYGLIAASYRRITV